MDIPEPCKIKGQYLCYILRSVPAPARTYAGSSNNFPHRLRQHNGELAGGASATKTTRPWQTACLVYGFTTRSAALRYEYFCKIKHAKISLLGKNSIQRRAALMIYAELMTKPEERKLLVYYIPDPYFRQCIEEARAAGVPGTIDALFSRVKNCAIIDGDA